MEDIKMSRFDKVIAGLLILKKYGEDICAEHDIIYAGGDASAVSEEDVATLEALHWHVDSSCGSYAKFV